VVATNPSTVRAEVAARLAIVAILVASVAGTAAFVKGRRDVEAHVLDLALEQARSLERHLGFMSETDPGARELRRRAAAEHVLDEHVLNGHFVAIEIYDADRRNVLAVSAPDHEDAYTQVEMNLHAALLGDTPTSRRVTVAGAPFLQVFAPLGGGRPAVAYFEGIYEVAPEALATLNRGVLELVVAVVGAIFATALALYPVILALGRHLVHKSGELAHANMAILAALGSAVAKRDRDTNAHNYRVTIYAIRLGVAVGLSRDQIRALVKGAFLHDVGKIAVADAILQKPGPLTPDEKRAMQAHVAHGMEIVGGAHWLEDAVEVVQFHHEKVDGTGYPYGLLGEEIPIVARVFAIVDVFDALTTRRPYKAPAPLGVAVEILERGRGTSFDPALLDTFLALAPDLHRRLWDSAEPELARTLDALLVEYFGVGASAAATRTLGVAALGLERPEAGARASMQ
jgi:HD-GYP domain-containing protein (c-di-GMP phosphodiesterase class II)